MGSRPSVLLLDKKPGITSFSSLYPVKRKVDSKVGHAGTLDKFAQGLMIVLTGPMTRLNPLFSNMDKEYVATILFGEQTSTLDPEGEVVATAQVPSLDTIVSTIESSFIGNLKQVPPEYSAVHIGGRRAYSLARSGCEVQMPERDISISKFEVISWEAPYLVARIAVSKGTYIRSIARDLGLECGSCARLQNLVRTRIGPYLLEEAVDPDQVDALLQSVDRTQELLARLKGCAKVVVSDDSLFPLANGRMPASGDLLSSDVATGDSYCLIYSNDGILRAVGALDDSGRISHVVAHINRKIER